MLASACDCLNIVISPDILWASTLNLQMCLDMFGLVLCGCVLCVS